MLRGMEFLLHGVPSILQVYGSRIRRTSWAIDRLSHYLQGFCDETMLHLCELYKLTHQQTDTSSSPETQKLIFRTTKTGERPCC